ncbi:vWA domain-containing protein [Jiulongibacter sp. NS-SX5]|uniref:vWA domain-containing protein n=1 Tax=Jiulongibacter sp. NS-SX5 TaxID=3463854 RepID=UPI004059DCF3
MKLILRATYIGLFIIALLGPSFGRIESETQTTTKDIIVAIDLSESMNSSDLNPSRLEKAKIELNRLIDRLPNNRLGLLVFSSEAYWLVPMTYDHNIIKEYLQHLRTSIMPNSGTNLSAALEEIYLKFKSSSIQQNNLSRVALVLTDGEDFGYVNSNIIDSVRKYTDAAIFVGVGSPEGSYININGENQKDDTGNLQVSKLDIDNLNRMAGAGDHVIELNNSTFNVDELTTVINAVGNQNIDLRKVLVLNNKYSNFLLVGLILALLDGLIKIKLFEL